jgi:hypothetical protein
MHPALIRAVDAAHDAKKCCLAGTRGPEKSYKGTVLDFHGHIAQGGGCLVGLFNVENSDSHFKVLPEKSQTASRKCGQPDKKSKNRSMRRLLPFCVHCLSHPYQLKQDFTSENYKKSLKQFSEMINPMRL